MDTTIIPFTVRLASCSREGKCQEAPDQPALCALYEYEKGRTPYVLDRRNSSFLINFN